MGRSVPEIFSIATEFIELMKPKPYDDDLLTYMSIMCPKKDSFANSKMRKPRVCIMKTVMPQYNIKENESYHKSFINHQT